MSGQGGRDRQGGQGGRGGMPASVAVVIPCYQRDAGILRRAVVSVLAQALPPGVAMVRIFVVDDGAPHPAEAELDGLDPAPPFALSRIVQPNAGPAAARNAGLDWAAMAGAEAVAFLDSDDIWAARHLKDALEALEKGYVSTSVTPAARARSPGSATRFRCWPTAARRSRGSRRCSTTKARCGGFRPTRSTRRS